MTGAHELNFQQIEPGAANTDEIPIFRDNTNNRACLGPDPRWFLPLVYGNIMDRNRQVIRILHLIN